MARSEVVIGKEDAHGGFVADIALNAEHPARSIVAGAGIVWIDALAGTAIRTCQQADRPAAADRSTGYRVTRHGNYTDATA